MKSSIRAVLALVMVFTLVSVVALARGAPTKEKHSLNQAVVSVQTAPALTSVPPMATGFDVIQNLTAPHVVNVQASGRGKGKALRRQSTTGDERAFRSGSYSARTRPAPGYVMLA